MSRVERSVGVLEEHFPVYAELLTCLGRRGRDLQTQILEGASRIASARAKAVSR